MLFYFIQYPILCATNVETVFEIGKEISVAFFASFEKGSAQRTQKLKVMDI